MLAADPKRPSSIQEFLESIDSQKVCQSRWLDGGLFVVNMNLQKWSAIAEILSSIAVLATLVFLVMELRQTKDAVRANTYQGMAAMTLEFNSLFLADPGVSEFMIRTASEDYELDPSEALRLRAFISSTYRFIDNVYFQYEIGTITEQRMESLLYPVVLNFRQRGRLRVEWEEGEDKLLLSPDLVEYLDSEIYKEELD